MSTIINAQYQMNIELKDGTTYTYIVRDIDYIEWSSYYDINEEDFSIGDWVDNYMYIHPKYGAEYEYEQQNPLLSDIVSITWSKIEDYDEKASVFVLDENKTSVSTSYFSVSFDKTIFDEPTKLAVTQPSGIPMPMEEGIIQSVIYDFNLENIHELTGSVEIRLPISIDNGSTPCAAYFDEQQNKWRPINHYYDDATQEIVIRTSHLSTYSAFGVSKEHTKEAKLLYLCYPWDDYNMNEIVKDLQKIIESPSPEKEAADMYANDYGLYTQWGLDFGYNTLESLGFESEFLGKFSTALGYIGVAWNAYQVCCSDFEGNDAQAAGITMKVCLNQIVGQIASVCKTSVMNASMAAVAVLDYCINKFGETAWSGRKDIYKAAFDLYYSKSGRQYVGGEGKGYRTAVDWFKVLKPIFERTDVTEGDITKIIDEEVTRYCQEFWDDETVVAQCMADAKNMGWTGGGGLNSQIKQELSNELRGDLYNGVLVSVFQAIKNKLENEAFEILEQQQEEYINLMNKFVTLKFIDSSKGEDASVYNGYKVRFANVPSSIVDAEKWETTINEKGEGNIQFRVFAYASEGFKPSLVLVTPDDEEIATYSFKMNLVNNMITTTIDLAQGGEDVPELEDDWKFTWDVNYVTYTNNGIDVQYVFKDEWFDGIKNVLSTNRTISVDNEGKFELKSEGLTISGTIDKGKNTGIGEFTLHSSYEYANPKTQEQIVAAWKEYFANGMEGELPTADNWMSCTITHDISGKISLKFLPNKKIYILQLSGEGSYSMNGEGITSVNYSASNISTTTISKSDGKFIMDSSLIFK